MLYIFKPLLPIFFVWKRRNQKHYCLEGVLSRRHTAARGVAITSTSHSLYSCSVLHSFSQLKSRRYSFYRSYLILDTLLHSLYRSQLILRHRLLTASTTYRVSHSKKNKKKTGGWGGGQLSHTRVPMRYKSLFSGSIIYCNVIIKFIHI